MQNRAGPWELSGYLGMSIKMLIEVYGHHHPDHQSSVSDAFARRPVSGAYLGQRRGIAAG